MAIQAASVTFESIQVGDELPVLEKTESQETINGYTELNRREDAPVQRGANLHTDEGYAQAGIFAGTVNQGVVTCAYLYELLQMAFPMANVYRSTFNMRALEPFRPGDVVSFTGKVLEKREEGGQRLVDVEVTGTNQLGQTIASAKATVPL